MVQRAIKIPKHSGPDGQGMNDIIFEQLLRLLDSSDVLDEHATKSIELCLSISKRDDWNNVYRLKLLEKIR